jgi:ubiquinone/menaquinone biosynthesis C-methylase UbiE
MDEAEIVKEVSTQEGYARWALSYDQEVNALIVLEEAHVDHLLASVSYTHALDVGTGTGRYALKLARSGASVTAIDQSPEMLARARQAARSEGLAIDFQQVSLEDGLPFAAQHFDLLTCTLMLCHLPDLLPALRECARVLRPAGTLLLTDFHPGSVRYGWRTAFRQAGVRYVLPNMAHTRETYLEALAACGLSLLSALDLPLGALPARDYPPPLSPAFIQEHAQVPFCLLLLARKS